MFQRKLEKIVARDGVTGVARRARLAPQTVSNWRKGMAPSLYQVQRLARGLGIHVCYWADDHIPVREYGLSSEDDETHGVVREDREKFLVAEKAKDYPRKRGRGKQ